MNENISDKDMNKALFAQLIMMLSSSIMQQLGKLVNPVTHKTEIDLEGAQMTIDMLQMLKEKTRGNLDNDEEAMLSSLLSSLQMNYVETMQSSRPGSTPAKAEEQAEPAARQEEPPVKEDVRTEQKDAKFHKSYGS